MINLVEGLGDQLVDLGSAVCVLDLLRVRLGYLYDLVLDSNFVFFVFLLKLDSQIEVLTHRYVELLP
jgi:hypothetical protein